MTTATTSRFERALDDLGATVERAPADAVADRIRAAAESPAIGRPVPFEGVSLPDSVDTDPTPAALESAETGVTPARFAIAEYGTLAIESTADGDEPISLYPDRHVAVVAESDVVTDLGAAFDRLESVVGHEERSVVFATGRSATGDMGELVHGVHGPREVHVVVIEDR